MQRNRGFEGSAARNVLPDLRVIAGATLLDVRRAKSPGGAYAGSPATGAPRFQATTGSKWDTPLLRGLTAATTLVYTGASYAGDGPPGLQKIPDWTSIDLGLRYATALSGKLATLRG